jgi:hypothetical protein
MSSATKDVDDLVRAIRATGTHNVQSNGAHHKVLDGAGHTVYVLPKTPSDRRWRENAIHELIKQGVFEGDPKKARKEKGRLRLTDPDVQAMKVAAVKARAARLAADTAVVRDRIQPLVTKIGGWGMREGQVTASELGMVAKHWGRDRPDVWKTDGAAKSSAQNNMKHAGGCSPQALGFWDAFVTDWELADDPRRWYFDLAREMKGLAPIETKVIVGGAELTETTTTSAKPNLRRAGRVRTYRMEGEEKHPLEPDIVVGHLALRAVALMAAGRETIDIEEVLEVGEQILALENRAQTEGEEE